ncbi:MAG: SDR family oxidoreductase [Solirubrobacteraceae bacterium]|nr:SDR family oxidoreductase [Solirubrobacteraceae bacterium]
MTRVAVVTGVARGIGAATAALLTEHGWEVVGIDREKPSAPGDWHVADLTDPSSLLTVLDGLDRIDGLVNNAALQHATPLLETTVEQWDAVQAVNVRAPFVAIRACAERLAAVGGAVVNVASVHALATSANVSPYAASKGALLALTRAAAVELGGLGVRVNAVAPGAVDTPALREGFARQVTGDAERVLAERTPLGRFAEPREIAEAVAFLLDGTKSGFMTGETLTVDGGVMARLSSE